MKKYIIVLLFMFMVLPSLVIARGEPPVYINYKVKVVNENGIQMKLNDSKEITIPFDTVLEVNYEYEISGKLYGNVEYNDASGMIEISGTELLTKEVDLEKYKSEAEKKIYVFDKGNYLYNGPSKAYGLVDGNIEIPVGTTLSYIYGDEAWAYVTYNNTKGWIYIYTYDDIIYEKGATVATIYNRKAYTIKDIELLSSPLTDEKNNKKIPALKEINCKYFYSKEPYLTYYYITDGSNEGWYKLNSLDLAESYEDDFIVNAYEDSKIYEKPDTNSKVLSDIKKDEEYNVLAIGINDDIENNTYESWSYVKYNNIKGWIYYIEKGKVNDDNKNNEVINNETKDENNKKDNNSSIKIIGFSVSIIIIILFIIYTILRQNSKKEKEEN